MAISRRILGKPQTVSPTNKLPEVQPKDPPMAMSVDAGPMNPVA